MVGKFLLANGFVVKGDDKWANDKCTIEMFINPYGHYSLTWDYMGESGTMYSKDLSIYWLIGTLTYLGLIDKNYNLPSN